MLRNLKLWISAFLVLAVVSCVKAGKGRPDPELRRVGIARGEEPPGVMVVPPVVRVRPGDAIAWSSDDGDWVAELPDELAAVPLVVRGRQNETAVAHILKDAKPGRYKYDVTLNVNGRSIRLDPLVVVEREEG